MTLSKMTKMLGLAAAVVAVSAGAALAATATSAVNVRTGPGTQFRAVDTLRAGERVSVVDQDGGWCAINSAGADGWVSCRYLSADNSIRSPSPNVSIQLGFGTRYPARPPMHHWRDDDDDGGYWTGPRSSHYSSGGSSFGLSFSN